MSSFPRFFFCKKINSKISSYAAFLCGETPSSYAPHTWDGEVQIFIFCDRQFTTAATESHMMQAPNALLSSRRDTSRLFPSSASADF